MCLCKFNSVAKFHCEISVTKVSELSNISNLCCVQTQTHTIFVKEKLSMETRLYFISVLVTITSMYCFLFQERLLKPHSKRLYCMLFFRFSIGVCMIFFWMLYFFYIVDF